MSEECNGSVQHVALLPGMICLLPPCEPYVCHMAVVPELKRPDCMLTP